MIFVVVIESVVQVVGKILSNNTHQLTLDDRFRQTNRQNPSGKRGPCDGVSRYNVLVPTGAIKRGGNQWLISDTPMQSLVILYASS